MNDQILEMIKTLSGFVTPPYDCTERAFVYLEVDGVKVFLSEVNVNYSEGIHIVLKGTTPKSNKIGEFSNDL